MKLSYALFFSLALGLWLLISPYALGFTDMPAAYWNALGTGLLAILNGAGGLYQARGEGVGRSMPPHAQKA